MGNRIENLSGSLVTNSVNGAVSHSQSVTGSVRQSRGVRELRFEERIAFPEVGLDNMLYIATDENVAYRWDTDHYAVVGSAADIIDDAEKTTDKTWSSSKIDGEIDSNVVALTNLEIAAILFS